MKKNLVYFENNIMIIDNEEVKRMVSKKANYKFDKKTGRMLTWGETLADNVDKFPSPTILDFEVTTKCDGIGGVLCPFCYKANNPNGENLDFETFKKIFDKLPKSITQIAFGADSKCKSNPDLWKMMEYSRAKGVIPNITAAEIDLETAQNISKYCGAVAISRYHDEDIFANSIKYLTDLGMTQVNCHMMISEETFQRSLDLIDQVKNDPRLSKLHAIVFLSLKTKGRGTGFHVLSQEKFNILVQKCKEAGINYGFDSCSSLKYFNSLSEEEYLQMGKYVQPCESTLESAYINVKGEFFPCSFTEGTENWETGLSVLNCTNFVRDIWNNEKTEEFRKKLLETKKCNKFSCRNCPIYKV